MVVGVWRAFVGGASYELEGKRRKRFVSRPERVIAR